MHSVGLFILLFSACAVAADEGSEEPPTHIESLASTDSETTNQKTEDLMHDMKGLELFLKDQEDHEKFCPKLKWDQPTLIVYKKKQRSLLPESCLPEEEKKLREKLKRQETDNNTEE